MNIPNCILLLFCTDHKHQTNTQCTHTQCAAIEIDKALVNEDIAPSEEKIQQDSEFNQSIHEMYLYL